MSEPKNKQLYEQVKAEADVKYKKPSAYKSGWIVKEYKKRGGEYLGSKTKKGLTRWFKEEWEDIGGKDYPVYRPTKRISKNTPLTASEIDPKQAKEQIARKQVIKGKENLPKFEKKIGGYSIMSDEIDYDKMKWGSFTKQFNASKKKLGVKDLGEFADHIISNPAKFAKKTLQRANFYKNVLEKGGAVETRGMKKRREGQERDLETYQNIARGFNDRLPQDLSRRIGSYLSGREPRRGDDEVEAMMGVPEGTIQQQTIAEMDEEDRKKREAKAKKRPRINFGSPFAMNLFNPDNDGDAGGTGIVVGSGYDAGAYPFKDPDDVYADLQITGGAWEDKLYNRVVSNEQHRRGLEQLRKYGRQAAERMRMNRAFADDPRINLSNAEHNRLMREQGNIPEIPTPHSLDRQPLDFDVLDHIPSGSGYVLPKSHGFLKMSM